jgi:hypothetical protein
MAKLVKLKDPVAQAGRWLGLTAIPSAHGGAVEAGRFDEMTWQEVLTQATALLTWPSADRYPLAYFAVISAQDATRQLASHAPTASQTRAFLREASRPVRGHFR